GDPLPTPTAVYAWTIEDGHVSQVVREQTVDADLLALRSKTFSFCGVSGYECYAKHGSKAETLCEPCGDAPEPPHAPAAPAIKPLPDGDCPAGTFYSVKSETC